jgi:hypothetical protein
MGILETLALAAGLVGLGREPDALQPFSGSKALPRSSYTASSDFSAGIRDTTRPAAFFVVPWNASLLFKDDQEADECIVLTRRPPRVDPQTRDRTFMIS